MLDVLPRSRRLTRWLSRAWAWGSLAAIAVVSASSLTAQEWPVQHAPPGQPMRQYTPAGNFNRPPQPAPNAAPLPNFFEAEPATDFTAPPRSIPDRRQPDNHAGEASPGQQISPALAGDGDNATSLNRDRRPFPIDPRKPCHICGGATAQPLPLRLGNRGKPPAPEVPGGCQCGSARPAAHPGFSAHWPRPWSGLLNADASDGVRSHPRWSAGIARLADFKGIDYQRRDNGYCGPGADPYGCLGESRYRTR